MFMVLGMPLQPQELKIKAHGRLKATPPPFWRSPRFRVNRELVALVALGPAWALAVGAGGRAAFTVALMLLGGSLLGALGRYFLSGENWKTLGWAACGVAQVMVFLVPAGLSPWLAGLAAGLGFILAGLLRVGPGEAVPAAMWGGILMVGFNSASPSGLEYMLIGGALCGQPGLFLKGLLILGAVAWGAGEVWNAARAWALLAVTSLVIFTASLIEGQDPAFSLSWAYPLVVCLWLAPRIKPWPVNPWAAWGLCLAGGLALGWAARTWGGWSGLLLLTGLALVAPWLDDFSSPRPFGSQRI